MSSRRRSRWDRESRPPQESQDDIFVKVLKSLDGFQVTVLVNGLPSLAASKDQSTQTLRFLKRLLETCSVRYGQHGYIAWTKAGEGDSARWVNEAAFGEGDIQNSNDRRLMLRHGFIDVYEESPRARGAIVQVWNASMFLQEFLTDPMLTKYSVLVIDDFYLRCVDSETILSFVKRILCKRETLRVIVVCASESSTDFVLKTFQDLPASVVDGRSVFSNGADGRLEFRYRDTPCLNVVSECANLVTRIHLNTNLNYGNIAVFLPTEKAIDECISKMENRSGMQNLILHKWVESNKGAKIHVGSSKPGTRNCIMISSVLEAKQPFFDATFYNVNVVIDSLLTRRTAFDSLHNMEISSVTTVTKSEAELRAKIGRQVVLRLSTENDYGMLLQDLPPEIQRCSLNSIVLRLKALRVSDIAHFDFVSSPPAKSMVAALSTLHALGAIDDHGDITTPHGERMARFLPLDPFLSKLLLLSLEYGCSIEALTIVAVLVSLNNSSLFAKNDSKEQKKWTENIDFTVSTFGASEGDLVMYLNIYNAWNCVPRKRQYIWCEKHALNKKTLNKAARVRGYLERRLTRIAKLEAQELLSCHREVEIIQKCICGAFFIHAARLSNDGKTYISIVDGGRFDLHPSSSLTHMGGAPPAWIVSSSFTKQLKHVTSVKSQWLLEVAPHLYEFIPR